MAPRTSSFSWVPLRAKLPASAETVTAGDPTYAGPLTGVSLGLTVYHVCEPEVKAEFDPAVYDERISMMEMVLDVDDIISEMSAIREQYCKYLGK